MISIRKVRSGIAHDRAGQTGLARGACSEVDLHLRTHGPERLEERIVPNVEALGLWTNPCLEAGARKLLSYERPGLGRGLIQRGSDGSPLSNASPDCGWERSAFSPAPATKSGAKMRMS